MKTTNRIQGKQNQRAGGWAEHFAERALWSLGFKCVEKYETGWRIKWRYDPKKKKSVVVDAKKKKKVSGDFNAIGKNGQYIHCEVKRRDKDVLFHSALEKHQVEAMNEKTKYGALCLLAWVRSPTEVKILRWPIKGFEKNSSLRWENIK